MIRLISKNFAKVQMSKQYFHGVQSVKLYATIQIKHDDPSKFGTIWPIVRNDLLESVTKVDDSKFTLEKFTDAVDYNVPHGKKLRISMCHAAMKVLSGEQHEEQIRLAQIFGWCLEMLHCGALINDDIMDGHYTRRNKPSWYKLPKVGMRAINDSSMIMDGAYYVLEKHFSNQPYYNKLLSLYNNGKMHLWAGQSLDLILEEHNVLTFSWDKFNAAARNKTSYYTFYMPIMAALYIAGKDDPKTLNAIHEPLFEVGNLFTIQDDVLDVYGDHSFTGDEPSDIQNNKCTWLAVRCVEKASLEQKKIIKECYGSKDPDKVAKVREIYDIMNLYRDYKDHEKKLLQTSLGQFKLNDVCYELLKCIVDLIKGRKF